MRSYCVRFLCVKDYIKRDNFFKSIPEESVGQLTDEYDPIFRDEYVTIYFLFTK
jgi:hypothetical protein